MFIDDRGAGPALLLLHGSPTSTDVLAPIADAFAATHRRLTPHFPGYGRTPPDAPPVSLADQTRRLEDALLSRTELVARLLTFLAA